MTILYKYSLIGLLTGLWLAILGFAPVMAETPTGQAVTDSELKDILRSTLEAEGYSRDAYIRFFTLKTDYTLAADASPADIRIARLDIDPRTDRFAVDFIFPGPKGSEQARLTGQIDNVKSVPVIKNQISPGDIITKNHIGWINLPVKRIGQNIIQSASALIGMTPRRPLRTDTPVRLTDVERPIVVKKGSLVTMLVENGALSLSAVGKALQNGADGDIIRIMNTATHRTIEGTVLQSGQVRVLIRSNFVASVQ